LPAVGRLWFAGPQAAPALPGLRLTFPLQFTAYKYSRRRQAASAGCPAGSCPGGAACLRAGDGLGEAETALATRRLPDAPFPLLPARAQGKPRRRPDRQPPLHAARRHDPPAGGGDLFLAAARLPRAEPGGTHRA